ncbi:hypothetical protein TNCV_197741 [Trichonephila clavipes]|nr:hypothetical protein TNCV_197741 [Trichonephila clavipes]
MQGFIKDCVYYVPPLPADLPDLRHRIEAVARITSDTPNKVWDELAYQLDVCRNRDYTGMWVRLGSTDLMAGKVMDGNESVADSFRSDLVGFKSWSGRILGAFLPSYAIDVAIIHDIDDGIVAVESI